MCVRGEGTSIEVHVRIVGGKMGLKWIVEST